MTESRAERWRRYWSQIHGPFVVVMVALTLALGLAAWNLLPKTNPALPSARDFFLNLSAHPSLPSASLQESFTPVPRKNAGLWVLVIPPVPHPRPVTWDVVAPDGLEGGTLCADPAEELKVDKTFRDGTVRYLIRSAENGILRLYLCWPHGGAMRNDGTYLAAAFPEIAFDAATPPKLSVSRQLDTTGLAGAYTLQGGRQPTKISDLGWDWDAVVNGGDVSDLSVFATSLSGVARDGRNSFLAGVLFGIAGAALVALIQELFLPLRLRRLRFGRRARAG